MEDLKEIRARMDKGVQMLVGELASFRTGRASPSLVENIVVPAYGGTQRLRVVELGTISSPDPQSLIIAPWDISIIGDIRKGILEANVGLTPVIDSEVIRIAIPVLTTEQRQQFVKLLHTKLENTRIVIRQIRHERMTEIKKACEAKELSEEERDRAEIDLQKLTDESVKRIDELGDKKEKELLVV
jgi:ribosome recycling factor